MGKKNRQSSRVVDSENKYKQMCENYQEREEMDLMNRMARERLDRTERLMHEHDKMMAEHRIKQQRKFKATADLAVLAIVAMVAIFVMAFLACTVQLSVVMFSIIAIVVVCVIVAISFRAGFLWHEIVV